MDLEAIRAREAAATPGPWDSGDKCVVGQETIYITSTSTQADAEFIAHARQDIPDLIDRVKCLESRLRGSQSQSRVYEGQLRSYRQLCERLGADLAQGQAFISECD